MYIRCVCGVCTEREGREREGEREGGRERREGEREEIVRMRKEKAQILINSI